MTRIIELWNRGAIQGRITVYTSEQEWKRRKLRSGQVILETYTLQLTKAEAAVFDRLADDDDGYELLKKLFQACVSKQVKHAKMTKDKPILRLQIQ